MDRVRVEPALAGLLTDDALDCVERVAGDAVGVFAGGDHLVRCLVGLSLGLDALHQLGEPDRHVVAVDRNRSGDEPEGRDGGDAHDKADYEDSPADHGVASLSPDGSGVKVLRRDAVSLVCTWPQTGFRSTLSTIFDAHNATKPPFLQSEFVYYLCVNFE